MNSFRILPESATRKWTIRDLSLSAEPTGEGALDTPYESPIREIRLDVSFLQKQMIEALPYIVDSDSFVPEWEFADESWNELIDGVTAVITDYNKKVIARARELDLKAASVIGRAKTTYNAADVLDFKPTIARRETEPLIPLNRVETVYEPSIRSSSTRQSTRVKRASVEAWIRKR